VEVLPAAVRLAGTTVDDLYARFGTGEQRTGVSTTPPALLPRRNGE
jgi:hypothetical protein